MPSPFPGMDPYLEARNIWPGVHHRLITAIGDALAPQVAPRYYVDVEQRTYIVEVDEGEYVIRPDVTISSVRPSGRPPGEREAMAVGPGAVQAVTVPLFEEVREGYLEIREVQTHEVITVLELLSPTNKAPGEGRKEYETKRRRVLYTLTSLVEIDLLRAGEPMEMEPAPEADYRILVRPGWVRTQARLYAFGVREPIPEISVPLREGDKEARLALGELLSEVYDRARYTFRLDYRRPPAPPLSPTDAEWANQWLRAKGLRGTDTPSQ